MPESLQIFHIKGSSENLELRIKKKKNKTQTAFGILVGF